jgi:hypothetical protein
MRFPHKITPIGVISRKNYHVILGPSPLRGPNFLFKLAYHIKMSFFILVLQVAQNTTIQEQEHEFR